MAGKLIKAKRRCCKDKPRCKRCPVVCKRLEQGGYYARQDKRTWVLVELPKKKAVKAARAR